MNTTNTRRIVTAVVFALSLTVAFIAGAVVSPMHNAHGSDGDSGGVGDELHLHTNEAFVERIAANESKSTVNLSDREAVFGAVFSRLDDEVTVYPTENYYYTHFTVDGRVYKASILMPADGIDDGELIFAYSSVGIHGAGLREVLRFDADDPRINVAKHDNFTYDVTYRGRTVRFQFNDIGMHPPDLLIDETYVGPVYDESGIRFHLVFNERTDDLYLLLDERGHARERYERVGESLVRGKRTKFVYYDDAANDRLLLVGVSMQESRRNSWYDGPFDQMPDNYIKTGQIPNYRKYIEAEYPSTEGKIDRYGNYLDREGARIAVRPYSSYRSLKKFHFVEDCRRDTETTAALYACLTRPRRG